MSAPDRPARDLLGALQASLEAARHPRVEATVPDRPTRKQAAHPGSRMVGESYKDHSARAFGMLRAAEVDLAEARAEVRALRAELKALDDAAAAAAVTVSGRRWAAHATILRREREEAREALGLEMGMRTAAVDELETLRRRLWVLLDADQLSDDDTVDRLRAALVARTPQPARPPVRGGTPWRVVPEGRPPEWKDDGYAVVTADWSETTDRAEHYVAERMTRETAELLVAAAGSAPPPAVPDGPILRYGDQDGPDLDDEESDSLPDWAKHDLEKK